MGSARRDGALATYVVDASQIAPDCLRPPSRISAVRRTYATYLWPGSIFQRWIELSSPQLLPHGEIIAEVSLALAPVPAPAP